ncbi:unnamed protein product [Pleuronectes platessa]|uniref:Uncharacterized protein n=1 Tax=Pleuronectes platessa TaxID=8262 RepID=A0A9N7TIG6_PLEPL|nr:unnamed protein product [Pleuronectes platessa]
MSTCELSSESRSGLETLYQLTGCHFTCFHSMKQSHGSHGPSQLSSSCSSAFDAAVLTPRDCLIDTGVGGENRRWQEERNMGREGGGFETHSAPAESKEIEKLSAAPGRNKQRPERWRPR